jgi:hypothetical protein
VLLQVSTSQASDEAVAVKTKEKGNGQLDAVSKDGRMTQNLPSATAFNDRGADRVPCNQRISTALCAALDKSMLYYTPYIYPDETRETSTGRATGRA